MFHFDTLCPIFLLFFKILEVVWVWELRASQSHRQCDKFQALSQHFSRFLVLQQHETSLQKAAAWEKECFKESDWSTSKTISHDLTVSHDMSRNLTRPPPPASFTLTSSTSPAPTASFASTTPSTSIPPTLSTSASAAPTSTASLPEDCWCYDASILTHLSKVCCAHFGRSRVQKKKPQGKENEE